MSHEAHGLQESKKVIFFSKSMLPKTVKVGEVISIAGKSGRVRTYKVIRMHDNMVAMDEDLASVIN